MSNNEKDKNNEKINKSSNNQSEDEAEDETKEILQTLNSNIPQRSKSQINENIKPENEDDIDIKSKSKYIKKYKSKDSRLYGITFQNSNENDIINIAVSSMNMNNKNNISILSFSQKEKEEEEEEEGKNNDKEKHNMELKSQVEVEYPVSNMIFSPHKDNKNLLISASDKLRLCSYENGKLNILVELKSKADDSPLTSCDWSIANKNYIGACSINGSCSIYDVDKKILKNIILAHDQEVYDISLGPDEYTFISTGKDGSIRLFDSRKPDDLSILIDIGNDSPLTRLDWNLINPYYILAVGMDKNLAYVFDVRVENNIYAKLKIHKNVVNNAIWAPQSNTNIITVSDDKSALLWDIHSGSTQAEECILRYEAENEIENVAWAEATQNWVGIIHANQAEVLRIQ